MSWTSTAVCKTDQRTDLIALPRRSFDFFQKEGGWALIRGGALKRGNTVTGILASRGRDTDVFASHWLRRQFGVPCRSKFRIFTSGSVGEQLVVFYAWPKKEWY